RAVLLNPAVDPARDLAAHVGEQRAWHSDERLDFRAEYLEELRTLAPPRLTHLERYCAIVAKGDEVLDWREMTGRYSGCRVKLLEGGDHALSDFEAAHLADVTAFLGLS
ncbi:MAG TPA: YqiA/YcfP family alpha/beta fold hydrolase, partial [Burkholderiaceae bacterium]|nr:YqiA/YcfP family alpha/beta fold hydrolase [Burkholderiaceae bacterium]